MLADDLLVAVPDAEDRVTMPKAVEVTIDFWTCMGAEISLSKCWASATSPAARAWLRRYPWGPGQAVPVAQDARDLGSHLCLVRCTRTATLRDRMLEASRAVHRLTHMPVRLDVKLGVLRQKSCRWPSTAVKPHLSPRTHASGWRQRCSMRSWGGRQPAEARTWLGRP